MTPQGTRISLRLRELNQLFNSMDPSPFIDRDLDHDAEEFIVSAAREAHDRGAFDLVVHLGTTPEPGRAAETEAAVRHYFAVRAELKRREFRLLLRRARPTRNSSIASPPRLAEKNKELEAIVYTVSHDLRSPLVNVQGFGKQLNRACETIRAEMAAAGDGAVPAAKLRPPVETQIPQALKFINAGVAKMETLLAGLLRYSRLGRVALSLRPLNVDGLLHEIVAAMKFQLDEAGAEVSVGALPTCVADHVQTSQVFANLLDNALKYRDPARPLRVAITGRAEGGDTIYAVRDNGIGIAPEHQAKVFDIFHRLNPDTTAGEGLGLTIAQRVLERQKGRIWVESRAGEGSTFFVALPAVHAAA